jgi:hypothetical protein
MRTVRASFGAACLKPINVSGEPTPFEIEIPIISHHVSLVGWQVPAWLLAA